MTGEVAVYMEIVNINILENAQQSDVFQVSMDEAAVVLYDFE